MPQGPRSRYTHRKMAPKSRFAKGSFRTIRIGKHGKRAIIGCPKGYWSKRSKRCRKGTRMVTMLTPKSSNPKQKVYGAAAASRKTKLKWLAKARRAAKRKASCRRLLRRREVASPVVSAPSFFPSRPPLMHSFSARPPMMRPPEARWQREESPADVREYAPNPLSSWNDWSRESELPMSRNPELLVVSNPRRSRRKPHVTFTVKRHVARRSNVMKKHRRRRHARNYWKGSRKGHRLAALKGWRKRKHGRKSSAKGRKYHKRRSKSHTKGKLKYGRKFYSRAALRTKIGAKKFAKLLKRRGK